METIITIGIIVGAVAAIALAVVLFTAKKKK